MSLDLLAREAPSPTPGRRHFASDNYSGMCPEVLHAVVRANEGHVPSYGNDPWTEEAAGLIRSFLGRDCDVFFVLTGTAANSLALASLCQSYHSILCHESAHAETDECGAPEFFSNGTKVLTLPGMDGKVDPAAVGAMVTKRSDIHYPKPRVLSLTQTTELGTVYSLAELTELGACARRHNLLVHLDGARFFNAVAALDVPPRAIIDAAGVDVLCLGGAKNGGGLGEAVVFFDRERAREFDYRCKQAGQLVSKMRFLSAQWVGLLQDQAWLRYARNANAQAQRLEHALDRLPFVTRLYPRHANAVFVRFPSGVTQGLRDLGWIFYNFIGGGTRLMCSWDTSAEDVDRLIGDVVSLHQRL